MDRIANAYKGLAMGVLLVVIMAMIVVIIIALIFSGQTKFISDAAAYLSSLLTFKLP